MTMGRPTDYTPELADRICDLLASGVSLNKICKRDDFPVITSIFNWLPKYPEFMEKYARARETQAQVMAEEILDISDDALNDYQVNEKGEKVFSSEHVQRSKLRVDSRKWIASKLLPKKYGEFTRTELTGKDGGAIEMTLADQIRKANGPT